MKTVANVTAKLAMAFAVSVVQATATIVVLNLVDMVVDKVKFKMWEHENYATIETDEE